MHILVVEEDQEQGRALVDTLGWGGHSIIWCQRDAIGYTCYLNTDAILVDVGLRTDLDTLDRLHQISPAPVLILVAHADVAALREAAPTDEYLVKPVDANQLLRKLEQIVHQAALRANRVVTALDVTVDLEARAVWVGEQTVLLTAKEFEVLSILARHAGQVVSRRNIEEAVWGTMNNSTSRSLNVHMTTLRAKINRPALIQTIHGFGYRFGAPSPGPVAKSPDGASAPTRTYLLSSADPSPDRGRPHANTA
ncbi:response regulator transcription factor [Pseudonocardia eucalypti]|uniref:Response regulator transcription factor n=1 Tax=Pseudonocardia eucalypti TaxID=648755 RepID=A0ABP9R8X0_9PSEU|nr:DNA-binding response OmpR family regulator [Pseudonocardia eucalypti]